MTARLNSGEWIPLMGLSGLAAVLGLVAGVEPMLAVGVALACGFVAIAFSDLTLGLAIFCCEPVGLGVEESTIAKLAIVTLFLAWLVAVLSRDRQQDTFFSIYPGVSRVLGVFLAWTALSAVWAENSALAFGSFGRFAAAMAVFVMTTTAVRTRRQALVAISALVVGAVAAAILSVLTTHGSPEAGSRLGGSSTDPDELAATLVIGVALAMGLALSAKRSPLLRLAAYAAATFCLFEIFPTVSRGGLIALGVMLIAAIVFGGPWRGRAAVAALLISLTTVFYFTTLAPRADLERIEQSTQSQARFTEGRTTIWTVAKRMVEANPVLGVGAGNFKVAARHYLLEPGAVGRSDEIIEHPKVAHSSYFEVLTGQGVVGLVLFLAIIAFSLRSALLAARNFRIVGDQGAQALARTLAIGMIGVLAADVFMSQQADKRVWLLLGLGPALLAISNRAKNSIHMA